MADPETIRQPRFEFFDDAEGPLVVEMRKLEQDVAANPAKHQEGIRILGLGTATVRRVIDFVDAHPDGSSTLRNWADAWDRRSDIEISFDPDSEAAAEKDPQITKLKEGTEGSRMTAEERRDAIRRRRLALFTERMQAFKEAKEQSEAA